MDWINWFSCFVRKYIKTIEYCFVVLLVILFFVNRISAVFTTNIELGTGESNNVWSVLNFINGKSLYTNPENPPFEIYQYAPLSQYLFASIIYLSHADNYLLVYHILRFITLLLNFCVALISYRFVRKEFQFSKINSLMVAFISMLLLGEMGWYVRPDALSIIFLLSACLTAYYSLNNKKYIFISSILTILALYTKQDAIQLIILIPFGLLCLHKSQLSIIHFVMTILGSSLCFLAFYVYYGNVFVDSVIGGVSVTASLLNAFSVCNRMLQLYNFYPILVFVCALYVLIKSHKQESIFLALIILGTFVFSFGSSMKLGSGPNYYILPNLLGLILLCDNCRNISQKYFYNIFVICWAYYFFTGILFHYSSTAFKYDKSQYEQAQKDANEINKLLGSDYYIYTDNIYLKLQMYNHSILPNTEYYPEASFSLKKVNTTQFYVFVEDLKQNWLFNHYLDRNSLVERGIVNGKQLYLFRQ